MERCHSLHLRTELNFKTRCRNCSPFENFKNNISEVYYVTTIDCDEIRSLILSINIKYNANISITK